MHGRLKVKTSEEQAEARRKEKEKMVKWYREVTEKIFSKCSSGEMDDELLQLTMDVLRSNSDLSTMWIIRRQVFESRLSSLSEDEATKLCKFELSLLEGCLRDNPKAYCVWLHRRWVLEHFSSPPWDHERALCDLFLTYDERNFHCWDYRRYVIQKAEVDPRNEFKFTTDKIIANFSNYSAWHYRSKLLPLTHPSASKDSVTIDKEALTDEYEMVHNAFYTDPSDQSPWFYHKWLLGRGNKCLVIGCGFILLSHSPSLAVAFNQPIKPSEDHPLVIKVNDTIVTRIVHCDWPKRLWSCDLSVPNEEQVSVRVEYQDTSVTLSLEKGNSDGVRYVGELTEMFKETVTSVSMETLCSELTTCQELLELEPENKWCVLTTLQLLEAVDPVGSHEEILNLFDKLVVIDPYRKGYYNDLRSRYVIGYELMQYFDNFDSSKPLDLANKGLTRLYYTEYMMMCQHVDLHGNKLTHTEGLTDMKCVQTLNLNDNSLDEVPTGIGQLSKLSTLSLNNNAITKADSFEKLKNLRPLSCLSIKGNPLAQDLVGVVRSHLPNVHSFNV